MQSILSPSENPVVPGLESSEIVIAKDQPEYIPLRALMTMDRVMTRWTPTLEQREAILEGADIYLEVVTFGRPLQPLRMSIGTEDDAAEHAITIGVLTR